MDWWVNNPAFNNNAAEAAGELSEVAELKTRLAQLESRVV